MIGPLPAPEGARVCADWEGDESAMAYRSISGAERPITDGLDPVFSCACQFADGSIVLVMRAGEAVEYGPAAEGSLHLSTYTRARC